MSVLPIRRVDHGKLDCRGAARRTAFRGLPAWDAARRRRRPSSAPGVSSATARAALSELEHDGLVVHSLHRGVEVVRTTSDDVRDIYAARRVFEVAGLEVLLRRRPVDVTWLEAAIERMGEAAVGRDGRALVEADLAFHLAIVAAAGSRRLDARGPGSADGAAAGAVRGRSRA